MQNYAENNFCRIQKQYIEPYKTSRGVGHLLQQYRTYSAEATIMQKNKTISAETNNYAENNTTQKYIRCAENDQITFNYLIEQLPNVDTPAENQVLHQEWTWVEFGYVQNDIYFEHSKLPKLSPPIVPALVEKVCPTTT